jgi:hypothetical protein
MRVPGGLGRGLVRQIGGREANRRRGGQRETGRQIITLGVPEVGGPSRLGLTPPGKGVAKGDGKGVVPWKGRTLTF